MAAKWTCHQTGACCRAITSLVMTPQEFAAVKAARPEVTVYVNSARTDGFVEMQAGPCPYLGEDGRCTVYAVRPTNCRRWMCGRTSADEPLTDLAAVPLRVLQSRDLRRQYALNQRRAMASWGHRMGWSDDGL